MRVFEHRDGASTEHLVTVYEVWILNCMVQRFNYDKSFPQEEINMQESILFNTLDYISISQHFTQAYNLKGLDVSLTLPGSYFFISATDEPDYQFAYIKSNEFPEEMLFISAEYNDDHKNQTILSLYEETSGEVLDSLSENGHIETSVKEDVLSSEEQPVIYYETKYFASESVPQLITVKDGWLITVGILFCTEDNTPASQKEARNALTLMMT